MKVLCVGYYDKFSRFFLGIKKELKNKTPEAQFKIFSLYFSGFFYSFLRKTSSSCLSFRAWKNVFFNRKKYEDIVANHSYYHNISLEKIVSYHFKLNEKTQKKQLLLQAVSYIDLIEKELVSFHPDVVLLIGDSRLLIEITKKLAAQHHIKTFYIEQGPFGTTVFDEKGVNANASIRDFHFENKGANAGWGSIDAFTNRNLSKKYRRSPFYRGTDYLLEFLLKKTWLYPPDLKVPEPIIKKYDLCGDNRFEKFETGSEKNGKPVFLLVFQVPFDVNMTHHSPFFASHFEILKNVHENLPEDSLLVIREHPLYKGKYEKRLYEFLLEKKIFIDCGKNLDAVLKNASVIIVNNSTVGLEAIAKEKPVVVLGNSYYDSEKLCLKLTKKENLGKLLKKSLTFKPKSEDVSSFLQEYISNHLIEGHISDQNLPASKTIARKINTFHLSQNN